MKWMNDLKELMYSSGVDFDAACKINCIIFDYDKFRAKSEIQATNAGKEWEHRLKQLCDIRAKFQ